MNERIKELADEATIKTSHKYHTWGDRIATETEEVFDKEKFAELIVRECALVAVNKDSGYMHPADVSGYMAAGRSTAAQMIKQHFGVEE